MSPITHGLMGWCLAGAACLEKRDRLLVTLAGVLPDVDGLGIIAEILTKNSPKPLAWWSDYHHVIGHNAFFALAITLITLILCRRKSLVPWLTMLSLHLHYMADVLGGRGPDGYLWTIPYGWPITTQTWVWQWQGQWALNSWQNLMLTAILLAWTFRTAWQSGYSPLEMISAKADKIFIQTLQRRFPKT